jgi:hypothetical protein
MFEIVIVVGSLTSALTTLLLIYRLISSKQVCVREFKMIPVGLLITGVFYFVGGTVLVDRSAMLGVASGLLLGSAYWFLELYVIRMSGMPILFHLVLKR